MDLGSQAGFKKIFFSEFFLEAGPRRRARGPKRPPRDPRGLPERIFKDFGNYFERFWGAKLEFS